MHGVPAPFQALEHGLVVPVFRRHRRQHRRGELPRIADEKHLLGAVTQRHERARLHSLRRLVDHHHVELTRHAREHAAAGEGERGTHHSRFVEDGELDAIALQRSFKLLLRGSRPRVVRRAHTLADERFHAHRFHAVMHVDPDANERGGVRRAAGTQQTGLHDAKHDFVQRAVGRRAHQNLRAAVRLLAHNLSLLRGRRRGARGVAGSGGASRGLEAPTSHGMTRLCAAAFSDGASGCAPRGFPKNA